MYPTENSETLLSAPKLAASDLNLTVHISRNELNNTINYLVTNLFDQGLTIDDGYTIHSTVYGLIDMQALNNQIITIIPLQVEITPGGFFSGAKIKGIISIRFTTIVDIFQDQLLNKTDLTSYDWISKPKINLLGLDLPIEPIVGFVIKKYKADICQTIDESIKKNFDLKEIKKSGLIFFNQPMYSSEDSIIHVFASPLELAIGPMAMTDRELKIPVIFSFESVIAETKPRDLFNDPTFSIRPYFDTTSSFNVQSRLPLPYIEQMLREQIINQKFGNGISSITVQKVAMSGSGKTLTIALEVTGAYNGKMDLIFDPVYEKDAKKIKLENFKLKTYGGFKLKKIIFSLIKGFAENKLRKSVEDQINSNLQDYLTNIHKMLSGTEIMTGVFLTGQLLEYEIKDIRFFDFRMYFNIKSQLKMDAEVRHIDTSKLIFKKT